MMTRTKDKRRSIWDGLVGCLVACLMIGGPQALAGQSKKKMDPNLRPMIVLGTYGAVGGTVLGVLTAPVSSDVKSIFVGTSVGLYLGVAIGLAYVLLREPIQSPPQSSLLDTIQIERAGRISSSSPSPLSFRLQVARF